MSSDFLKFYVEHHLGLHIENYKVLVLKPSNFC